MSEMCVVLACSAGSKRTHDNYSLKPEDSLVLLLEVRLTALQVLNIAVYRALGEKGVYYGSKLGKKVQYQIFLKWTLQTWHACNLCTEH